jgi:hypothetical protein
MSATPARPLPPAVRDKLGRLLPMLSSNHDGERVGAVAAIERVLKSNNCDWHDLAASITGPAPAREPPRSRPQSRTTEASATMDAGDLIDLITMVRDSGARIGSRSEEFLDGLLERAGRFTTVFLSPKQKQWLDDLALKAKGAAS